MNLPVLFVIRSQIMMNNYIHSIVAGSQISMNIHSIVTGSEISMNSLIAL